MWAAVAGAVELVLSAERREHRELAVYENIDKQFLDTPWYGFRQMARYVQRQSHKCGRHRARRLMRLMCLVPIYQTPNTSKKHPSTRFIHICFGN